MSAWTSANPQSRGQVATAEKPNEIAAIPELLHAASFSTLR